MIVLITGASRGIGWEVARQLTAKGHQVIAVARNKEKLNELQAVCPQNLLLPLAADLSQDNAPAQIAAFLAENRLQLNCLINNAGAIVNKSFGSITMDELKLVFSTNVFAPFMLIQHLLPFFDPLQRGHIVNIGSMGGFMGSAKFSGLSAYSSSKGALVTLTECLAEELKDKNIAVNCLCLGSVDTEMLQQAFPGYKANVHPQQMAAYIANFTLEASVLFNGKILPVSSSTP